MPKTERELRVRGGYAAPITVLYGREVDEGDLLNLEAIAKAVERILKETEGGE